MAKPTKEEIQKFSTMIEELVSNLKCGYLDAILHHCDDTGLEIELASKLISAPLKGKIADEAEQNNMMKKTSKLPI